MNQLYTSIPLIISGLGLFLFGLYTLVACLCDGEPKIATLVAFPIILISTIMYSIGMFIPSQKALIAMFIANEVTYARTDAVIEKSEDAYFLVKQEFIDIMREVNAESNEKSE